MNRIYIVVLALVVSMGVTAAYAHAEPLYGGNGSFYSINKADGSHVVVDSGNPAYRLGLAYDGLTGVMYSVDLFNGGLYTVDVNTGNSVQVGDNNFRMTGLTFSGDFSTLYSFDFNGGPLLKVNPLDGSAVVVGNTNAGVLDMSTNSAGVVYAGGFGGIYTINTNTGLATSIGGVQDWTAIAFDENDVLYGIDISTDALYTIDVNTGLGTLVGGDIGSDVRGLAFAKAAVPEPGTLALLGLGLVGIGLHRRRKQSV